MAMSARICLIRHGETGWNASKRIQAQAGSRKLLQLRERHFGIFQGPTADEGVRRYPKAYAHYKARDPDYDFETGGGLWGGAVRE